MSAGAAVFMAVSWVAVLGWAGWSFWRVMTSGRREESMRAGDGPRAD